MSEHKLNITWSEFAESSARTCRKLWMDEAFTDVILATSDDHQISSHKVILSSCSPFFRNILLRNPHQKPLLYLKDVRHRELELILQFVYKGECQVEQENIEEFLAVGKTLKINGLKDQEESEDTREVVEVNTDVKEEPVEVDNNGVKYNYTCETIVFPNNNDSSTEQQELCCDYCYFTTTRQSHLRRHKAEVHEVEEDEPHEGKKRSRNKKYHCDLCDFKASRLRLLKHHKVSRHEADKPYPCDRCDYQALSAHILKIHKTSKHDRVQYNCDRCDYTTNWQANLTTHKRKKHTEPEEELARFGEVMVEGDAGQAEVMEDMLTLVDNLE